MGASRGTVTIYIYIHIYNADTDTAQTYKTCDCRMLLAALLLLFTAALMLLYCCFTASLTTAYKRPATAIGNQKLNHSLSLKLPFSLKKKKIRGGGGER